MAMLLNNIWQRFRALLRQFITNGDFSESHNARASNLLSAYGIRLVEKDSHKNARPWHDDEIALLDETLYLLGSTFYGPFLTKPLNVWIDRLPGGGSYGHQWLQLGEPGHDLSILYRICAPDLIGGGKATGGFTLDNKAPRLNRATGRRCRFRRAMSARHQVKTWLKQSAILFILCATNARGSGL